MTGSNDDRPESPLSCQACQRSIKAWLDGELDSIRAAEVERHTQACADCRSAAGDLREVGSLVRSLGDDTELRLAFPGAARKVAAAAIAKGRWAQHEEVRFVRLLQRVASAAAAVLVIALGLQVVSFSSSGPDGVQVANNDPLDGVLELIISDPSMRDDL
jgi:anti-sigma factor RsiW